MGELSEYWNDYKLHQKEQKEKRNNIYEPILIRAGAEKRSDGVYILGNWLCYPTKAFCMHKKNFRKRKNIEAFLREIVIKREVINE